MKLDLEGRRVHPHEASQVEVDEEAAEGLDAKLETHVATVSVAAAGAEEVALLKEDVAALKQSVSGRERSRGQQCDDSIWHTCKFQ